MASMGPNIAIEETWAPEPELLDRPPRRTVAADYPDLNGINMPVFLGLGGVFTVAGVVLFILGLAKHAGGMIGGGIVLALLGIATVIIFPARQKQHIERSERLVEQGMPVAARLISADPLNGSPTARVLRYQVPGKDGELVHKQVNADDAVLPKRIPTNVTALIDLESGDVELYMALPFRAAARSTATTAPVEIPIAAKPEDMGTIPAATIPVPTTRIEKPKEEPEQPKRETYE
jgi:hypothetical protein